jgi:hypothetical protein
MILPLGHTALFETVRPMAVWDAPSPNEATRQGPTRIVCPQDLRDFKTIRPLLRKCRKPQEQGPRDNRLEHLVHVSWRRPGALSTYD